jgi:hypothetical protein
MVTRLREGEENPMTNVMRALPAVYETNNCFCLLLSVPMQLSMRLSFLYIQLLLSRYNIAFTRKVGAWMLRLPAKLPGYVFEIWRCSRVISRLILFIDD